MKKFVLLFLFAAGATLHAGETIKPYGSLTWMDGIPDAVDKLRVIPGITTLEFAVQPGWPLINVKDATNAAHLAEIIQPPLVDDLPEYFGPAKTKDARSNLSTWLDSAMKEHFYILFGSEYQLIASNMVIQGIPFTLTADFRPTQGFGFTHSSKTLTVKDSDIEFPVSLDQVTLKSIPPITPDQTASVSQFFTSQYKLKFTKPAHPASGFDEIKATDPEGRSLSVKISTNACVITYTSYIDFAHMEIAYQEFLDRHQKKSAP